MNQIKVLNYDNNFITTHVKNTLRVRNIYCVVDSETNNIITINDTCIFQNKTEANVALSIIREEGYKAEIRPAIIVLTVE